MRKAKPKKRIILPDPVFNDQKVSKFVNHLMYDGKKNASYEIFYAALETVKAKLPNEEKSALEIWKKALDNVTPQVEVKSRRVGGATFQVYVITLYVELLIQQVLLVVLKDVLNTALSVRNRDKHLLQLVKRNNLLAERI